jgi:hypothetical protein
MGKGGHVNRKEPEGIEIMEAYEDNINMFDQVGWYLYCTKLDGYHFFAACNLSVDGKKWFKNNLITGGDVNQLLKPEHRDPNWAKGIPRDWIVD